MVRKLKYHEQKLLKKVDFITWKSDHKRKEVTTLRKYMILNRDDYRKYSTLARKVQKLANLIRDVPQNSKFRTTASAQLIEKLYMLGLIKTKWSLKSCQDIVPESFCKRRLPVMMVRCKMMKDTAMATKFVQQGHVRVGPEVVKDPAFLVPRSLEDFVTWCDASAIKRQVLEYNEERDDYNG